MSSQTENQTYCWSSHSWHPRYSSLPIKSSRTWQARWSRVSGFTRISSGSIVSWVAPNSLLCINKIKKTQEYRFLESQQKSPTANIYTHLSFGPRFTRHTLSHQRKTLDIIWGYNFNYLMRHLTRSPSFICKRINTTSCVSVSNMVLCLLVFHNKHMCGERLHLFFFRFHSNASL